MATGESRIRPRWRLGLATAAVVCCHASSASLQDGAGVAVATERSSSNYPLKRSSRTSRPSAQTRPSNGGRRGVGVLDARGGGAGDPDVRAGRAAAAAAGGEKKKTPLNVLKELMASMEESDYGSYGMWGDLKEDVATGPTSMGTSTSRGSSGSAAETGSLAVDDPATASSSPPAAVAADLSGRWANEDLVARDVAAAMAANPAFGGRRARAAAKAAAQVDGDELNQDQQQFEHDASNNRRALAPGATNAPRSQWATVAVPPDAAEDLTLEEPPVGTEGAEDFVKKALRTAYRLAATAALGMVLAYVSVVPPGAMVGPPPPQAGALAGLPSSSAEAMVPLGVSALSRGLSAGKVGRLFRRKYNQNCALLLAAAAPSVLFSWMLFDGRTMSAHAFVRIAFDAMTVGYGAAFVAEIVQATAYRVATFAWLEPDLLKTLSSRGVSLFAAPWVFREQGLKLGPFTSFVMDVLVDCAGAPLVEEAVKLWVVLRAGVLPKQGTPEAKHTHVHTYLGYLLAASLGLKMADNARRVGLYARPEHHQRVFFAFARGVFPVHEICGALTAMQLAKRNVLGKHVPLWKLLFPAVALHAMGNFRGKKPLFKWASSHPWVEMQLQAWSTADDAPPGKVIANGMLGLFWLSILARVLIYLCRRYYTVAKEQRRLLRLDHYIVYQQRLSAAFAAEDHGRSQAEAIPGSNDGSLDDQRHRRRAARRSRAPPDL